MRATYFCVAFGTPDMDRCNALAARGWSVTAYEWKPNDKEYVWKNAIKARFTKRDVSPSIRGPRRVFQYLFRFMEERSDVYVFYGYQKAPFYALALAMRASGRSVVLLYDSKFDDYPRQLWRDALKSLMLRPYSSILPASQKSADYLRYMGLRSTRPYYCAVDTQRIAAASQAEEAPPFSARYFICIARFHAKKNHHGLLDTYEAYVQSTKDARPLLLCGYGDLETEIRERIAASPTLRDRVQIRTYLSAEEVAAALRGALALLLPSIEEQFGIVVTEAFSTGVPVIVGPNCGAAELVDFSVNGFIVPIQSTDGWAWTMQQISKDASLWERMSIEARRTSATGDVDVFCDLLFSTILKPVA